MGTELNGFESASAMVRALTAREISAQELLETHLTRIARYNPTLNAIVGVDFDGAREAARQADESRSRGLERPLLGLPITIKDAINVRGLRTTAGVVQWAEYYADSDAPLTAKVRAAGAVIVGKTNVPPMLTDWTADNPVFGRTNNPWDTGRTPGGSTGGGAAALAAGLTPLEFGSDIGGSLRIPAAFCGVYGHKPSETAVPRSGQFPGPALPNSATSLGVQGPLARSAADLELALDVVAGPDAGEDVAWRLQFPRARHDRLADFRVAVLPPVPWLPVDDAILATLDRQANSLAALGARVRQVVPEGFGDLSGYNEVYQRLLLATLSARLPDDRRRALAAELEASDDEISAAQRRGLETTAAGYISLHRLREQYRAAYRDFFRDWDVLLAPATIVPAFTHPDPQIPLAQRSLIINGRPVSGPLNYQLALSGIATLTGQPATAFPAGSTDEGLPIGLQAIGPYLEDWTAIRFAELNEREWGGFRRPPGYEE